MKIYTYSEARQKLSSVLEEAEIYGKVMIKRRNGTVFTITKTESQNSPLDVPGVDTDIKRDEIVDIIREIRER